MNLLIKGVSGFGKLVRSTRTKNPEPTWKLMRLPPPYHGDFRPDLFQDIDFFMHMHMPFYQKWTDSVRVRMATRKLKMEDNSKYIPTIYEIVQKRSQDYYNDKNLDISTLKVKDIRPILCDILSDLSFNVYIKEHRYRYQEEQKIRFYNANKKFNCPTYYWKNKSVESFVNEYNQFIWHEIKKSHLFLSPKIEANYRRNYHDGEISRVTSAVFFLYFKTDKVKRFFSKLLMSAYRNPYSDKQPTF